MKNLRLSFFAVVSILAMSCGGGGSDSGGGSSVADESEPPLAKAMARWIPHKVDRAFLAKEAERAGVDKIKPMDNTVPATSVFFPGRQPCGYARWGHGESVIYIDDATRCRFPKPALIAHEISHHGARPTCASGGHGNPFWAYFEGIAKRYTIEVANGGWGSPLSDVSQNRGFYVGNNIAKCRGIRGIE